MRFLKKLLISVYVYLALFTAAVLMLFGLTGNEPTALVGCVFAVAGVESMLGAVIKSLEAKKERKERLNGSSDRES